jgi:hypothetical protein
MPLCVVAQNSGSAHATAAGGYVRSPRFFRILGVSTQGWTSQVYRNALGIARISEFFVSEVFATDATEMGQI